MRSPFDWGPAWYSGGTEVLRRLWLPSLGLPVFAEAAHLALDRALEESSCNCSYACAKPLGRDPMVTGHGHMHGHACGSGRMATRLDDFRS